jgi:transposase-like protein
VDRKHTVIDVAREFATDEQCFEYLEQMRWPEGVRCLSCDSNHVSKYSVKEGTRKRFSKKEGKEIEVKAPARVIYQCLECDKQFTPTTGTVFHDTHLPLATWFNAIALMCDAKKGVSAMQVQRHLDIGSYKTAWFLNHRIRQAMQESEPSAPLSGVIECDESYIGGKLRGQGRGLKLDNKSPVFGMVERGGRVCSWHIPNMNRFYVVDKIKDNISIDAELVCTDESQLYKRMPANVQKHEIVNHSAKEYVRGEVHTGTIDGYWGLFKRGLIGSYHRLSIKHLHRYLAEFDYRWNHRRDVDPFAKIVAALLIQGALEYKKLTGNPEPEKPADSEIVIDDLPF